MSTWKFLGHQNVLQFRDFLETSNNIYLLVELASRGNLETRLLKEGRLPQSQAVPVIYQITRGIEYLHAKGIFHRDIKT